MKIDHTQRSALQACNRYYLLRHFCGVRKATPDAPGFTFGSAFHATTEIVDRWKDINLAMVQFAEMFNFPDDKVRTLGRARELLERYQKFVSTKKWEFIVQQDDSMELTFCKEMAPDVEYAGKVDRILISGDIAEYKTTYYLYNSSGNPLPYLQQWWGHNSIRGYAWATDAKVCHIVGVGVYPQKPKGAADTYPCIETLPIPILDWEKEVLIYETKRVAYKIMAYAKVLNLSINSDFKENIEKVFSDKLWRAFITNTSRCYFHNNPCQFVDLCTRDMPRGLFDSNYVIDPFLPWEETTDA